MRTRVLVLALSRAAVAAGALAVVSACGGSKFTEAAEAGTPAADAGGGYCLARAADMLSLCSDFDEAQLPESWDSVVRTPPNGTSNATEDTADPSTPSPPSSFLAFTPALGASIDGGASPGASALVSKRALPRGDASIGFDFNIGKLSFPSPSDSDTSVTCALISEGTFVISLALYPVPNAPYGLAVVEYANPVGGVKTTTPHPLAATPAGGAWTHVKLSLSGPQITVQIGTARAETITLSPTVGAAAVDRTFTIGAASSGPTGDVELRFDNVTWSKL